jgi:hypothetical protein
VRSNEKGEKREKEREKERERRKEINLCVSMVLASFNKKKKKILVKHVHSNVVKYVKKILR